MKPSEQLIAARALIEQPERWTRGEYARTKSGQYTKVNGKYAACFCAIGAVAYVLRKRPINAEKTMAYKTLLSASIALTSQDVDQLNDYCDHATVMRMYDKAIEFAQQAEGAP